VISVSLHRIINVTLDGQTDVIRCHYLPMLKKEGTKRKKRQRQTRGKTIGRKRERKKKDGGEKERRCPLMFQSVNRSINQSKHIYIAPYVANESEALHNGRD